jgi:Putative zinc-finger
MPHLDEGTLHALLDGELELAEVKEIQTHLGACAACGSRLHDVKQFLSEADRLVADIQTPPGAARVRREPAAPPVQHPPSGQPFREPIWDAAPELLLPGDPEDVARRRRWTRRLRWAAMIVVVLGLGRMAKGLFTPDQLDLSVSDPEITLAPSTTPPAVISPEETMKSRQEAPPAPRSAPTPPAASQALPRAPRPAPEPKVLADRPIPDTAPEPADTTSVATTDSGLPPDTEQAVAVGAAAGDAEQPRTDPDEETRAAAAAALEELDRERLRSRANAATAALPPPSTEAPAPAPPAPRTLEQKSQTYLRIGLDEAARQLGRPMHVIEAMQPEFIGLARGGLVPGADPNRPVVRVVYRDTRNRMILLDQQRLRTGQAPGAASGSLRWILGDVMLYLHGEPGNDVLRNLQRRVR